MKKSGIGIDNNHNIKESLEVASVNYQDRSFSINLVFSANQSFIDNLSDMVSNIFLSDKLVKLSGTKKEEIISFEKARINHCMTPGNFLFVMTCTDNSISEKPLIIGSYFIYNYLTKNNFITQELPENMKNISKLYDDMDIAVDFFAKDLLTKTCYSGALAIIETYRGKDLTNFISSKAENYVKNHSEYQFIVADTSNEIVLKAASHLGYKIALEIPLIDYFSNAEQSDNMYFLSRELHESDNNLLGEVSDL